MTIAREEIFGPVLSIIGYEDEDDAVRIANDTPYGLSGYVSSGDVERARRVARAHPHRQRPPQRRAPTSAPRPSAATSSPATAASGAASASRSSSR